MVIQIKVVVGTSFHIKGSGHLTEAITTVYAKPAGVMLALRFMVITTTTNSNGRPMA